MSLISYYPLSGNGEDVLGNGPTNSLNFYTFEGEIVGGGGMYLNLLPMTGDYTVSTDIYRIGYTADWCIDFSSGDVSWGTGGGTPTGTFTYRYSQNYGYPYLYVTTKQDESDKKVLFNDTTETIGKWYHAEAHRKGHKLELYFNGELVFEAEHPDYLPVLNHVYFFNAGSHQSGGGYVKNLRLYDSYYTESALPMYSLIEKNNDMYGIKAGDTSGT